jgi:amino acid transporter
MQKFQKKEHLLRFLTWIEIISIFIISFCIFWLRNVLVGAFYLLLVFVIVSWLVIFVMTNLTLKKVKNKDFS